MFLQKLQDGESPSSSPLRSSSLDGPEYHHHLHKLEYDTVGVKETMAEARERFAKSSKAYSEMLSTSSLDFKRSDLTTESSLRLYCSMFDEQQASLSQADMSYILGEKNLSLLESTVQQPPTNRRRAIAPNNDQGQSPYYRDDFVNNARRSNAPDPVIDDAHAGLTNCGLICYSNVIFQGLASCLHVSEFL